MNLFNDDVLFKYIKTKNKLRKIYTYRNEDCNLRKKHELLVEFLKNHYVDSKFSKAYVEKESIYTNAKAHMYNDIFIMLDIKNFFNSINHNRLIERLLFELNTNDKNVINKAQCASIVEICSVNKVGIPLGFVTSPILSNIYLKEFDSILYGRLKKMNLSNPIYTRYADDMCISFKVLETDLSYDDTVLEVIKIVENTLERYGLKINKKKSRSYSLYETNHVKITGVNITKKQNNYRRLTVGNAAKNKLFWDAINCYKSEKKEHREVYRIKGMLSFILSVEKSGYDLCYSNKMIELLNNLGFSTLKELIDHL